MLRIIAPITFLFLVACGSSSEESSSEEDGEKVDNITEYEIDEDRTSAVDFNNDLSLMQEDMLNVMEILFLSDTNEVDVNYDNARFEAEINLSELEEMEFDGSEADFIARMKDLMNFYLDELDNGFKGIMPLLKKSQLSGDEEQQLSEYDAAFVAKEKEIFMQIFEAQDQFAEENNISLLDQ